jgi:TRAP-type transport system periplasmic protein
MKLREIEGSRKRAQELENATGWQETNLYHNRRCNMKKLVLCAVIVVCFVLSIASIGRSADVIRLKYNNFYASTHFMGISAAQFCEDIKKRTNGRVEISHYPGATLTPPPRVFDGVVQGISDIGLLSAGYTRGRFPVIDVINLPLGFPSGWVASHVSNDFYEKFKPKEWDSVHPLFFYGMGPVVLSTAKKPVKTLDDFKGLKLRAVGRVADMTKLLGGIPQPLEIGDVYEALRRGVLDGTMLPLEPLKAWKTGEILKHVTASWKVGISGTMCVVMNKEKWNILPADIRKIFEEVSAEYSERSAVLWSQADIDGRDFLKSQGGTIVSLSDAESAKWIAAVQPMLEDYKKELVSKGYTEKDADGFISYVRERIDHWRKIEKERKIPTPYE